MKTSKIIVSLMLLATVLAPVGALAVDTFPSGAPTTGVSDLSNLYSSLATLLWQIVAIVALVMFVIAGILFLLSQGDPGKVATARQFVLWGVVGIVVALLAYSIVGIVTSFI